MRTPRRQKLLEFTSPIVLAVLLLGCGRETKIYPETEITTTESPDLPIFVDGRSILPNGFYDQSVNGGLIEMVRDQEDGSTSVLRLRTLPGARAAGGYNGPGTGNRALLGVTLYDRLSLHDLEEVSFDMKQINGTERPSVVLLVDLQCNGTKSLVLTAAGSQLGNGTLIASTTPGAPDYTRLTANIRDSVWTVSGDAVTDPSDSTVTLVPSSTSGSTGDLNGLISQFPSACLRNSSSGTDDMPYKFATGAVLLSLGSPTMIDDNSVLIKSISIGSDIYGDWSEL